MTPLKKILFPTDFSDLSLHALTYAVSFAQTYRAELHVLHVVDEAYQYWMAMGPGNLPVGPSAEELLELSRKELEKFVAKRLGGVNLTVVHEACVGRPFMEIIRYAKEKQVDMIVLGTHGRSGLRHALLGSVAERVVRKSPCAVLTIREPGHEGSEP